MDSPKLENKVEMQRKAGVEAGPWRKTRLAAKLPTQVFESSRKTPSVLIQVLVRDIILWHFMRVYFSLVGVVSCLNAGHGTSLEQVPFLRQFVHAFRVRLLRLRQALQVSRLTA